MKFFPMITLVLSLTTAAAAAPPPDAKAIAEGVDRRYNGLRSLRAEFTEIYTIAYTLSLHDALPISPCPPAGPW